MSCLYSSPEVTSFELLALDYRCHRRFVMRRALRAPNRSAVYFHTDFTVRRGQLRRAPLQSSAYRRLRRIIQPAKTSTGFSREFSSAISGFRSLCGRKQRSSLKPSRSIGPAFWNLSLGAGSRFENSGPHPQYPQRVSTGPATLDRCCKAERSRFGGIFQVVFLRSNQAFSGPAPAGDGTVDTRQIGFGGSLER